MSFNVPVNAVARGDQNSPFGPAFQIYRYRVPDNNPAKRGFQQRLDTITNHLLPDPGEPPAPGVVFYCIDCGITGSVAVAGSFSFTLLNGICAGNIAISGSLRAGIQIGLDALVSNLPEHLSCGMKDFPSLIGPTQLPGSSHAAKIVFELLQSVAGRNADSNVYSWAELRKEITSARLVNQGIPRFSVPAIITVCGAPGCASTEMLTQCLLRLAQMLLSI